MQAYEPVINVRLPPYYPKFGESEGGDDDDDSDSSVYILLVYFNHYYYCFSWSNCLLPNEKQKIATKSQNCLV